MAPIKFDEKLREKLEERTITPSEMTWDKLDSKLDKLEKKKNKKPFWWLGLAASFIGILFISNLFFKADTTNSKQPVIVDIKDKVETKEEVIKVTEKKVEVFVDKENLIKTTENKTEIVTNSKEKINQEKAKTIINTPKIVRKQEEHSIAIITKKEAPINTTKNKQTNRSVIDKSFEISPKAATAVIDEKVSIDNFETQKINEVIAKIQELKANSNTVTDAEIDSLLNNAERDIFKNRSKTNSTRVVDSNSLLSDVENELEQSFRDRVFETIKSGYKTVRTAVVERKNN